jgi:hypothetical protein
MAMAVLAKLASVAWHMGHGAHRSDALGQLGLGVKSPTSCFSYFQKNCCKVLNLVKYIEKYLLVGKMRMTYQNAQKNVLYMFTSNSCIFRQL